MPFVSVASHLTVRTPLRLSNHSVEQVNGMGLVYYTKCLLFLNWELQIKMESLKCFWNFHGSKRKQNIYIEFSCSP